MFCGEPVNYECYHNTQVVPELMLVFLGQKKPKYLTPLPVSEHVYKITDVISRMWRQNHIWDMMLDQEVEINYDPSTMTPLEKFEKIPFMYACAINWDEDDRSKLDWFLIKFNNLTEEILGIQSFPSDIVDRSD